MPLASVSSSLFSRAMSRRQSLLWLAAGAAGLLSGCDRLSPGGQPATPSFKGIDITGADYARGFSLTDFNGQTRTLADFQGRVVMLYFGFVQCPDVCPTALTRAAAVMERLGPRAGDLQVVFVTVDPERDTPELLREYMAAFHPSFLALTGNAEQIAQTAINRAEISHDVALVLGTADPVSKEDRRRPA